MASGWQKLQVCISLQIDNDASTTAVIFFVTGRMPFMPPNQQRQSTEGVNTECNCLRQMRVKCSVYEVYTFSFVHNYAAVVVD